MSPASATSTSSRGACKRAPWDLRGQLSDLLGQLGSVREALGQTQGQMQRLEGENRELESSNQALRQEVEQLQTTLGERKCRESSLSARVSTLELELSQRLQELQQSRHREEVLLAEERLRQQETDEALGRVQALSEQLENTGMQLQQTQQQLQEQLEQVAALRELVTSQRVLLAEHEERIHRLDEERRTLHNDLQELRGNIRVFCRVRPLLPEELQRQQGLPHLHFPAGDARSLVLTRPDESQVGRERRAELRYDFSFDRVFPPSASQQDIFKEIQLLVQSALDGYPVCIFAYGQTGSGKTFTMEGPALPGPPESRGMIPRAVRHLFHGARELAGRGWQYDFSASFLEIYNEGLRDLLLARGERGSELEIRRLAPDSDELHVPNLTWVPVHSEEQVPKLTWVPVESEEQVGSPELHVPNLTWVPVHSEEQVPNLTWVPVHSEEQVGIPVPNLTWVPVHSEEQVPNLTWVPVHSEEQGENLGFFVVSTPDVELHVPNLTWVPVHSEEQVLELLLRAGSQRSVARTGLNERSSRSHSVFQLRIQGQHAARDLRCASSLTLVDLAGSERLEKSGSVGSRLRETQSINSSLSALGLVISALCNKVWG
ncbi:carboxy-terminal kinesin 2-like [Passerculus sandwichensis]